ncbi:MAG: EamA family transporter [Chloroflexota bacterium]
MSLRDLFLLFVLAALWGASFLFVRVAVPIFGPFLLVEGRVLLGGLILLCYALAIGQAPNWRLYWKQYFIIGMFNNALPFTLIAIAQLDMTASLAALLNATTPLFSAVIAALWIQERLTISKVFGLFLGILGVGIIVGWQSDNFDPTRVNGILLMLGASLSYGIAVVYGKTSFQGMNPVATSTGQLLSASLLILPFALANPVQQTLSNTAILSLLGLAIFSTSIAYLIYFHLIEHAGPTNAASVTLLIPFFSSLWGAIFLGEQLRTNEIMGFGVILVSLLLVTGIWRQFLDLRTTSKHV